MYTVYTCVNQHGIKWYVKPRGPNCSKMSVGPVGSTEGYFYFNWKMIDRHGRCSFKVNVH